MISRYVCNTLTTMSFVVVFALVSHAQQTGAAGADDGRAVVQRACGNCHALDVVFAAKKTKEEWTANVNDMIAKGAQVTPTEFGQIVDYLASYTAPAQPAAAPAVPGQNAAPTPRGPGRPGGPGPLDRQVIDGASATRGRSLYIVECVTCHGATGRGAEDEAPMALKGSDLIRSATIAHDRYGSTLEPFFKAGHPLQSGKPSAELSHDQIADLSNFLHKQVDDTLSGGAYTHILNVLTGDPKAGQAYFNGPGRCNSCHSPAGDLAGIAKRYDPPTLQQQFVFPRTISRDNQGHVTAPKPVTVTVVSHNGSSVSGVLDQLDDFSLSLTDASGNYHAWTRAPGLKVEKHDPYQAHIDLLDRITDKNIHDVVAYLETLQ